MTLSHFGSTETLKDPEVSVSGNSVTSSPTLAPSVKKDPSLPSTPAESIYLESQTLPLSPYHVFPRSRKLLIVCIVSSAAIFSPLSSNIYFPALSDIANVGPPKDSS